MLKKLKIIKEALRRQKMLQEALRRQEGDGKLNNETFNIQGKTYRTRYILEQDEDNVLEANSLEEATAIGVYIRVLDPASKMMVDEWLFDVAPDMTQTEVRERIERIGDSFTNGFVNWYETHHEIITVIDYYMRQLPNEQPESLRAITESQGSLGIYELAKRLTDEFEDEHEGREWDGEFFDLVEAFVIRKLEIK